MAALAGSQACTNGELSGCWRSAAGLWRSDACRSLRRSARRAVGDVDGDGQEGKVQRRGLFGEGPVCPASPYPNFCECGGKIGFLDRPAKIGHSCGQGPFLSARRALHLSKLTQTSASSLPARSASSVFFLPYLVLYSYEKHAVDRASIPSCAIQRKRLYAQADKAIRFRLSEGTGQTGDKKNELIHPPFPDFSISPFAAL